MGVKRGAKKTGRPAKVPGEKATKEKIFDAAIDLFADRGYDRVSVRDIARAVGLTEGAVYKHYASKEDILKSIFAYVEQRLYAPPDPGGDIGAFVEAMSVRDLLETAPRYMMANPVMIKITRIMISEMNHNEKIRDYLRLELFDRPVDETEAMFRRLMEAGKIRHCDPRALATVYISFLVYWFFQTFLLSDGSPRAPGYFEKSTRAQIDLLTDLLEPDPGKK